VASLSALAEAWDMNLQASDVVGWHCTAYNVLL